MPTAIINYILIVCANDQPILPRALIDLLGRWPPPQSVHACMSIHAIQLVPAIIQERGIGERGGG